ncbi:CD225/dispanin family protein, partial [Frankia sp. CpI1-P]
RQMGDVNGALDASKKARMWCIISVLAGVASFVIFLIVALVGGFDSSSSTSYSTLGPAAV